MITARTASLLTGLVVVRVLECLHGVVDAPLEFGSDPGVHDLESLRQVLGKGKCVALLFAVR